MKQFYRLSFLFILLLVFICSTALAQKPNKPKNRVNNYSAPVKSAKSIKSSMKKKINPSAVSVGNSVLRSTGSHRLAKAANIAGIFDFSAFIGSFNSISGTGTAVGASGWDDETQNNIPIGFTFYFGIMPCTEVSACSNGWLSFNSTTGSTANGYRIPNNLATDEETRPFITPLYGDLLVNGDIYYETNGTAPNRTFTIEWNNVAADYEYIDSNSVSFQVILYETTNTIQFVYTPGPAAANTFDNPNESGIAAGLVNTNGSFISVSDLSTSATISSVTENDYLYTPPPDGLTFQLMRVAETPSYFDFSASIGSFNSISGTGTAVGANGVDDDTYLNIPIGFTFYYETTAYTAVAACTNGWLSFNSTTGSAANGGYPPNNLTMFQDMRPFVTPLYGDIYVNGDIYYETNGTAPNRTFTIEWNNVAADYCYYDSNSVSFQVILYETTDAIQFVYTPGPQAANTFDNPSESGIAAGLVNVDGGFISIGYLDTSTSVSSMNESDYINTPPPDGLTFVFTPAPYGLTGGASNIGYTTATLDGMVFPRGSSANVMFLYSMTSGVYTDSINASPYTVTGSSATPVSASVTGLIPRTTYYYNIAATSGGNYRRGVEKNFITGCFTAGKALKFYNNRIDYVSISNNALSSVTNQITMEAWINSAYVGQQARIVDHQTPGDSNGYILDLRTGQPRIIMRWENLIAPDTLPIANTWYHIAGTYDGSYLRIFVNGSLENSSYCPGPIPTNTYDLRIGASQWLSECFSGLIDEVRIWNTALDSTQIRLDMHRTLTGSEPGLIGYWQFNEETDTIAHDLTAGGNDGTLKNFAFDEFDGWRTSTAPFGAGTSANATPFTGGTANLGSVSLTTTDAFDNPVELIATAITALLDSLPGGPIAWLSDRYWFITPYGIAGTFSVNLTFIVPTWFTKNGSEDPSTYRLYHRGDNSDGSWTLGVSGASIVTDTTIEFDGIGSLSQFMIGSTDASLDVQSNYTSPREFALYQNYPNPFNPTTTINYTVPAGTRFIVSVKIFDLLGREVAILVNDTKPAGSYQVKWNASGMPSGVYFCRLQAGTFIETKKLVLLK